MTKQEAIKEGLNGLIGNTLISIGCSEDCIKEQRIALDAQEELLDNILEYLDSQGVGMFESLI